MDIANDRQQKTDVFVAFLAVLLTERQFEEQYYGSI